MSTLVDLVDMTEKPEGVHRINTKLFSISSPQLRGLQELPLESTNFDYFSASAVYRVTAITLDSANFTCLSILLATFNYRARGTCSARALNFSFDGAANA